MKGPSIDAIRRFKEQQELKKREEDERKVREKLSTLEHRAAQGDRKAKLELKKITKLEEERSKSIQSHPKQEFSQSKHKSHLAAPSKGPSNKTRSSVPKARKAAEDFQELMKVAQTNNNEIRPQQKPPKPEPKLLPDTAKIHKAVDPSRKLQLESHKMLISKRQPQIEARKISQPQKQLAASSSNARREMESLQARKQFQQQYKSRPIVQQRRRHYDYEEEDEEDEYDDDDGFVVDDEEEDAQEELRKTLQSVFRYDKRRCDRREEELDRMDRAIGRVTNIEDLEREERRASKLAAAEDARALREEKERKRLKKMRLKGH